MVALLLVAAAFVGAEPAWGRPLRDAPAWVDPFWIATLASPWAKVLAFVWGALWGSFANVVIYRLPRGMSVVRPRSRCSSCETPLGALDNIPILSYLLLRGRCRHCKAPYSARYVIVEVICATLSFALYVRFVAVPLLEGGTGSLAAYGAYFLFCLTLVVVTYIDLDLWIIPDVLVLPVAGVGLVVDALAPEVLGVSLLEGAASGAVAYLIFAGIRLYYLKFRGIEGLGLGDAKLLVMVGAFTGTWGVLWTVGAGALQGLLVSVPMLLAGREVANTALEDVHGDDPTLGEEDPDAGVQGRRVPFGPFLALAALEFVLLRDEIAGLVERFLLA